MTDHSALEAMAVQYLQLKGFLVIRTHTAKFKPVDPGISDLLAIRTDMKYDQATRERRALREVLAVEIKAGRDVVSEEQLLWLARARDHGVKILVIRTFEELKEAV